MSRLLLLVFFAYFLLLTPIYANFPYGVKKVGTRSGASDVSAYGYDTAGNRLSGSYQGNSYTADYSLIGKPAGINVPHIGNEIINYRPGGSRYSQRNTEGEKTFYVGDLEYQLNADKSVKAVIVYIRNGAYSPVTKVNISSTTPTYEYFLQDHQGTPLVTVNHNSGVQSQTRYDTQGVPVNITNAIFNCSDALPKTA